MRDLHTEKRNLIKKIQECEELKLTIKYLEQKFSNLEVKLEDKENFITRLKQKYIQLEQDTNRFEYEYQRLRNNQTTLNLTTNPTNSTQSGQPKSGQTYGINNLINQSNQPSKQFELPIRHEQPSQTRYPVNTNSNNQNQSSPSSTSSSSTQNSPPNINSINNRLNSKSQPSISQQGKTPGQLLTIVCNLDNSNSQSGKKKSVDDSQIYTMTHSSRLTSSSFVKERETDRNQQPRPKSLMVDSPTEKTATFTSNGLGNSNKSTNGSNHNLSNPYLNDFDKYKIHKEHNSFEEYLNSQHYAQDQQQKTNNGHHTLPVNFSNTSMNNFLEPGSTFPPNKISCVKLC
jgi:hypothetical protein